MRHTTNVKPVSDVEAQAADVPERLAADREPLLITQNGEAKAVLQDVASFDRTHETMALLKLLALGRQDIEAGLTRPVEEVVAHLRAKHRTQANTA